MNQEHLNSLIDVLPYLSKILQEDINFAVADLEKLIAIQQGKRIRSNSYIGEKLTLNDFLKNILETKKPFCHISQTDYFEIPTKTIITPVIDKNGVGCGFIFAVKDMEQQVNVESATNSIFKSCEEANVGVEEIASESAVLSTYIKDIVEYVSETVKKIGEIDSIIQVIKNISSKTNLLALNATIEAARAGEAGKGFSIVAKEMGKLSMMSRESADKVTKSLLSMKAAMETINDRIGKIGLAAENQASATEEIAASVDQVLQEIKHLSNIAKLE